MTPPNSPSPGCDASGNVTIAVASDVGASTNTVLVTVQDGTKSKDREVTASITVSVIDSPSRHCSPP